MPQRDCELQMPEWLIEFPVHDLCSVFALTSQCDAPWRFGPMIFGPCESVLGRLKSVPAARVLKLEDQRRLPARHSLWDQLAEMFGLRPLVH